MGVFSDQKSLFIFPTSLVSRYLHFPAQRDVILAKTKQFLTFLGRICKNKLIIDTKILKFPIKPYNKYKALELKGLSILLNNIFIGNILMSI